MKFVQTFRQYVGVDKIKNLVFYSERLYLWGEAPKGVVVDKKRCEDENRRVARRFVSLVLDTPEWRRVCILPQDEIIKLVELVKSAGYKCGKIVYGKLAGKCGGREYFVNHFSNFIVVDENCKAMECATAFLNSAFLRVVHAKNRGDEYGETISNIVIFINNIIAWNKKTLAIGERRRER